MEKNKDHKRYQGRKAEIDYLISATRREHITSHKVLFKHPIHSQIGSDIIGFLYHIKNVKLIEPDGDGKISIKCKKCKTTKKYDYTKFSEECLHVLSSEDEDEDESE